MKTFRRVAARLGEWAGELAVLALAAAATLASFAGADDSAYLFPRLISAAWLGLCVLHLLLRRTGAAKAATPDWAALRRAAPGGAIILAYAALAEALGFYLAAFCAFLALATVYDRRGGRRRVIARILVACAIIVALRLVFSELLRAQTPRGVLF